MQRLEDYPQTDEGGVALVRDVFQRMGGTVVPPPDHHEDGMRNIFQSWRATTGPINFEDAYCEQWFVLCETGVPTDGRNGGAWASSTW